MVQGGEIKVVLTLDNKDFTVRTVQAGETIRTLKKHLEDTANSTKRLDEHFNSAAHRFRDLTLSASLVRFAIQDIYDVFLRLPMSFLKTAGEIERLQKLMQGLSKETDDLKRKAEAAAGVKFVFNLAQNAPFEVKALADSFVKLKTAGIDPTNGSMQALVDSVAKFGGTSEHLHRASIAIQQMAGKGVISMEELRQQLGEAVPNAIQMMAQGMDMSMADLVKAISKGTVESKNALSKMLFQMELENRGAAAEMMDTWTGMVEKLKTKWSLLQNEIAANGFFIEAKSQLNSLLDGLDSEAMQRFAQQLGQALGNVVKAFSWAKEMITEYGDEIEAFLIGLFALKVANAIKPFSTGMEGVVAAFKRGVDSQIADGQRLVVAERMQSEVALAEAQKRLRVVEQEVTEKRMQYSKQIGDIRTLNAEIAASNAKQNGALLSGNAERIKEVAALKQSQKELMATITLRTEEANTIVRQIQLTNQHIVALREEGIAAVGVTNGTKAMAGAKSVLGSVVSNVLGSIKGFGLSLVSMGVQFAAITAAVEAVMWVWDRVGFAAQRSAERIRLAKEAIDDFNNGIVNADKAKKLAEDVAVNKAKIETLRMNNRFGTLEEIRKRNTEIAELEKVVAEQESRLAEINARLETNSVERAAANADAKIRDIMVQASKSMGSLITEQSKMLTEIEEKLKAKEITEDEANKRRVELRHIRQRQQIALEKKALQDFIIAKGQSMAGAAKAAKDIAEKEIEAASKMLVDLDQKSQNLIGTDNVSIGGKGGNGKGKTPAVRIDREDPLTRAIQQQQADVEQAKIEMQRLLAEIDGFNALKSKAMLEVLGDVAAGKYDSKETTTDENGKQTTSVHYLGADASAVKKGDDEHGLATRKRLVEEYAKALREGKGDVDQFLESQKWMTQADKDAIKPLVEAIATREQEKIAIKTLGDAHRQVIATQSELSIAAENYANGGLAKMTSGMSSLTKKFAEWEVELRKAGKDLTEFNRLKKEAFSNQSQIDALNWATDKQQELTKMEIEAITTVSGKRQAEHEANLKRIEEEFEMREKALLKSIALEEDGTEKKAELEETLAKLRKAFSQARLAEDIKYYNATKSEFEKLLDSWLDVTENMNKLTGNWASKFGDAVTEVVKTGKFQWREMVQSMVTDLKVMLVKAGLASIMKGVFGGSAFSLDGGAGGAGGFGGIMNMASGAGSLYQLYNGFTTGGGTGMWGTAGNWLGGQFGMSQTTGFAGMSYQAQSELFHQMAAQQMMEGNYAAYEAYTQSAMDAAAAGETAGAWSGAATGLGYFAALLAVAMWLDGKSGGPKKEGDAFGTVGADGSLTYSDTWVDGGYGFTTGSKKPLILNPAWEAAGGWEQALQQGIPQYIEQPGSRTMNETIFTDVLSPIVKDIGTVVKGLGGTIEGMQFGFGYSLDPEGSASDQMLATVADKNGKEIYNHSGEIGGLKDTLPLEIKRMTLAAIDAADINPIFDAIIQGVDLTTASVEKLDETLNAVYSINEALKSDKTGLLLEFADELGKLDPTLMMTTINGIVGLINTDFSLDIATIENQITESNQSLWASYNTQQGKIGDLITKFDGSAAATANLTAGLGQLQQTTVQVLANIMQASKNTHESIQDTIRSMQMSTLDNAGKYNFLELETEKYRDLLKTAIDPELIAQYADQIRQNALDMFNLLPEAQRTAYLSQYENILNETDDLAQQRYAAARTQIQNERTENANAIKGAIQEALDAWLAKQAQIAGTQQQAANTQLQAANTPIRVEITSSEVGYGLGGG